MLCHKQLMRVSVQVAPQHTVDESVWVWGPRSAHAFKFQSVTNSSSEQPWGMQGFPEPPHLVRIPELHGSPSCIHARWLRSPPWEARSSVVPPYLRCSAVGVRLSHILCGGQIPRRAHKCNFFSWMKLVLHLRSSAAPALTERQSWL